MVGLAPKMDMHGPSLHLSCGGNGCHHVSIVFGFHINRHHVIKRSSLRRGFDLNAEKRARAPRRRQGELVSTSVDLFWKLCWRTCKKYLVLALP